MSSIEDLLAGKLAKRQEQGTKRSLTLAKGLVDFASNDYLGFARFASASEQVRIAAGSGGSRLLTGNSEEAEELERKIAKFHQAESALVYSTGYMANLGLLSALGVEKTSFIYDLEVHASTHDGMKLSKAQCFPFRHNDLDSLATRLVSLDGPKFVLVESIYSISGDVAPLREMINLCLKHGAALIVDEAHAAGVCGPRGEGLSVELGIDSKVFARTHTFGKALGAYGAGVLGSRQLIDYLINFSRPFIYTTALPAAILNSVSDAYNRLAKEGQQLQRRLRELIAVFRRKALDKGLKIGISAGPIQPVYQAGAEEAREKSACLRDLGMDVRPILPPTTARGKESLRVILHSFNTEAEVSRLVEAL